MAVPWPALIQETNGFYAKSRRESTAKFSGCWGLGCMKLVSPLYSNLIVKQSYCNTAAAMNPTQVVQPGTIWNMPAV